jgi:anthranilate phosphoribosyltransferase
VAKHGNRSHSSRCGSADVLEALGVRLDVPVERMGEAIRQIGIGFLFAPAVHTAMRHAAAARRQVGGRTIFNLLGPLTNPAGAKAQVLGVFDARISEMMARALDALGCRSAFVVHGADGLDEISLSGETHVTELRDGAVTTYTVTPEDFGLNHAPLKALAGGDSVANAQIILRILEGDPGPPCDIVLANAAAALVAAGLASDWRSGVALAAHSIDSGAARRKLDELTEFTNAQPLPS